MVGDHAQHRGTETAHAGGEPEEQAGAVGVKTIQRLFTAQPGMTFGRWRQQARLLRALERLATGEKVIDVAVELGYESPSAFASMFRKQFRETPGWFFGAA